MKYCLKTLVIGYWLLVIGFIFAPTPLFAQGEVESSQHVSYQVSTDSKTHVRHEVRLTNLTTNYYVSEYSLFLGFTDIKDIQAFDSQGSLKKDVATKDNGTDIHLVFNEQVVGKGNTLFFTISYETDEITSKNGRIWEINIPRIKDAESLGHYTASLIVPSSFGMPTYIKPPEAGRDLLFEKEDVLRGISVVFGEYQLFDYTLGYHVRNSRLYPIVTEIALPPETSYQEVLLNELTPKPLTVYRDRDGNWLAKYRLEASQRLDIVAKGKVKIFHEPKKIAGSKQNLDEYLTQKPYWDVESPTLAQKAKELATPRAIYDYVVQTLSYDYDRIDKNLPRAGAVGVFDNPKSAICMEFTDLFIAMARAAGIPAREVNGYALTENSRLRPLSLVKDILHAWPEYYDKEKEMWIAIDPTWGNTSGIEYFDTFDFNHFTFVVKGLDSQYPVPAGSYKEEGDREKKDVEVTVATDLGFPQKHSVLVSTDIGQKLLAGFPIHRNIRIVNSGNAAFSGGELRLTAHNLLPASQKIQVDPVPPFGDVRLPFTLKSPLYVDNFSTTLTAHLGEQDFAYNVHVSPIYLVYLPWIGGGIGAGALFIVARTTWHLYLQRRKGANPLRGQSQQPQSKGD